MRIDQGHQLLITIYDAQSTFNLKVPFAEGHPYFQDPVLPSLLKRLLPPAVLQDVQTDLARFGGEVMTTMRTLSKLASPPQLVQYDQWGKRVDELQTSEGWRGIKALFQKEGIIGIFYERTYHEHSRVYGFAKILLATGDSQMVDCPMSMTDGCARVLELLGTSSAKNDILPRLISRDPCVAFTAGQWMTERPGGSDISLTETVAKPVNDANLTDLSPYGPRYTLDGFKWFSSATDSDVALALARTGSHDQGSRGLSLFLIPLRFPMFREADAPRPSATGNRIYVHRLKDKIGTRALPTAELSIQGAEAYLIGEPGQGVKLITSVLNITRLHSATTSVGSLRRCLAIATSYSAVRAINGGKQLLQDTPLHVAELAKISVLYHALVHMLFGAVALIGKTECGVASEEEALRLRLLTPAVKAFAAEKVCTAMEECMAALGGAGYMTENEIGRLIQDALVEKIWEGTITVLSLDIVRVVTKSAALSAFVTWANKIMASCPESLSTSIADVLAILRTALDVLVAAYASPISPLVARPALFLFSHIAASLNLLEHAAWAYITQETTSNTDMEVFRRWVEDCGLNGRVEDVRRAKNMPPMELEMNKSIVYGNAYDCDQVQQKSNTHRARL